ncbi:prolyl oligopeptidase family serine peptidase, partial [Myxococcota bacterium]|nr:prolyl oligopeptidase family serine peptidase [Myxococcota bacterium]MBU1509353.1 prolyl oligopeptidase family serine peptidase [Myxococcota bacterium]
MKNANVILLVVVLTLAACDSTPYQPEIPPCPPCAAVRSTADGKRTAEPAGAVTAQVPSATPVALPVASLVDTREPDDPADAKRAPVTLEALYEVKSVGFPRLSPDGLTVLYTISTPDLKTGKSDTDIWKVSIDGTSTRQMTRFEGADFWPLWAPDGRSFFFLSARKGGVQLWRMPVDGGDPERLTHVESGLESPVVSPAGTHVAFISEVYPEAGGDSGRQSDYDPARQKEIEAGRAASPHRAMVADHLFYRRWNAWKEGRRRHVFVLELGTGKLTDLTPGDFDSPAFTLGEAGLAFSPDGRELAFESNREVDPDAHAVRNNTDVFVVPVSGGEPRNLTASNAGFDGSPAYSPDGTRLAWRTQPTPGYEADRFALRMIDRATGAVTDLAPGFPEWIEEFRWVRDRIVFVAPVKGRFPLFELEVASGKVSPVSGAGHVRAFDCAPDGTIAFTHSTTGRPAELNVRQPDGKVRPLSAVNRELVEKYDFRPARELWIDGDDGAKIHTFVVLPHGYRKGKKYPLVINVHGGPQMQWSDNFRGDWQVYPGAGAVVAFPNPHGSTGYGQPFTAAISRDWGGKVYRDVMAVTDHLSKQDYVDASRMALMGWSWGGYLVNWVAVHPHPFVALASMMGVWDLPSFHGTTEELWFPEWDLGGTPWEAPEAYEKFNPASRAARLKTPMLVITGEKDYRIAYTQSLHLFTALRRQNIPARLVVLPDDGHWPHPVRSLPLYYTAHLEWFATYLQTAQPAVSLSKMLGR